MSAKSELLMVENAALFVCTCSVIPWLSWILLFTNERVAGESALDFRLRACNYVFALLLGRIPAAVAPVPAAAGIGANLSFLRNMRLIKFVDGTIAVRANHGVAQTLSTSLTGSSAFVTAHAVANLYDQSALHTR